MSCASLGAGVLLGIAPPDLSFLSRDRPSRGVAGTAASPGSAFPGMDPRFFGAPASATASLTASLPLTGDEPPTFGSVTQPAKNAPSYTVSDLGPLEGTERLLPVALNNRGEILACRVFLTQRMVPRKRDGILRPVGYTVVRREGILFNRERKPVSIPALPGFPFIAPTSLNNQGQVIGVCGTSDPMNPNVDMHTRAVKVFQYQNGKVSNLLLEERAQKRGFTLQNGLSHVVPGSLLFNDRGQIVLQIAQSGGGSNGTPPVQAFLFQQNKVTPLYPANYRWLNNKGVLLGRYGDVFSTNLPNISYLFDTLAEGSEALPPLADSPRALNDARQVLCVESSREYSGTRSAFRLWDKGRLKPLVTLDAPLGPVTMNNRGHVAGMVEGGVNDTTRLPGPYLYRDGKLYDMNTALMEKKQGWHVLEIYLLNDRDEMLAKASRADGSIRTVLLRPLSPEESRPTENTKSVKEGGGLQLPPASKRR